MAITIQQEQMDTKGLKYGLAATAVAVLAAVGIYSVGQSSSSTELVPAVPIGAVDARPAAEWANQNRLSGLSPSSLGAGAAAAATATETVTFDTTPVAVWAEENGLTGLSPASVR